MYVKYFLIGAVVGLLIPSYAYIVAYWLAKGWYKGRPNQQIYDVNL